jgi:hypothetical protein
VVVAGAALTLAWQMLLALFATSVRELIEMLLLAVVVAAAAAGLLLRFGDRGAAVGVSLAAALGGSVVGGIAAGRWLILGWPL